MSRKWVVVAASALAAEACMDATGPVDRDGPAYSVMGAACATAADHVVTDGQELADALSAATEGDVIAINGMIEIWFDANVEIPGLTLTCHSPGSGLRAEAGAGVDFLVIAKAPGLTVEHIAFDASETVQGAFLAAWNGEDAVADDVTFAFNDVRCGPGRCVLVASDAHAAGADVAVVNNTIRASGVPFGIQVQGFRRVRVEENVVEAEASSPVAIGVSGSENVHVNANRVSGPWSSGIQLWDGVYDGFISENILAGVEDSPFFFRSVDGVLVAGNRAECGTTCALMRNEVFNVTVEDNSFVSYGSMTGVHLQAGTDGVKILRNRILAVEPSTFAGFGAIRVRDGRGAQIVANDIRGPWASGIALGALEAAQVDQNHVDGVSIDGIRLDGVSGAMVTLNRGSAAGIGIALSRGCFSTLLGNQLLGGVHSAVFGPLTGANVFVGGSGGGSIVDDGAFDCDEDGEVDRNQITSQGRILSGVGLGMTVAGAVGGLR